MGTSQDTCSQLALEMNKVRAPHFSRWLCRMKRNNSFTWRELADYLDVSPQCIDSYSTGRAHPQLMRFHLMIDFLSRKTSFTYDYLVLSAMGAIRQDAHQKHGK
jgi:hypothetical protein